MKSLLLCLLVAGPFLAGAQQLPPPMLASDINGRPVPPHVEYKTEGSPFFITDYCTGNIKVQKGKKYIGVPVKLNLKDNAVYFKLEGGEEMIANVPIEYIEFTGCSQDGTTRKVRAGFPAIDKNSEETYYEVLSEGPVTLLKHFFINYQEQSAYGSATVSGVYKQMPEYYAYSAKTGIVKLKNTDATFTVLAEHKDKTQKFMDDQHIKVKKEADLIRLVAYYNTL